MTEKIYETYSPEETHALENAWAWRRGKARRRSYAGGDSGRRKDSVFTQELRKDFITELPQFDLYNRRSAIVSENEILTLYK